MPILLHWFILIDRKSTYFKKGVLQNVPDEDDQDIKAVFQKANGFGIQGYSGPCPPAGETHKYTFEVYALNNAKGTSFGDTATAIRKKLKRFTIAKASLNAFFTNSLITQLEAGGEHTCELFNTGGVKCWGGNDFGQLGDGTSGTDRLTPVSVSGLTSGVTQIAAGDSHTCALLSTGAVKCWGSNDFGQLGDGTSGTDRLTPVSVSGLTSGVTQISAGDSHTCALLSTGEVKCWGSNDYGQIGDNTAGTDRLTPVFVSGLASPVTEISAGFTHTCAILNTGAVSCWGSNDYGQLGDNTAGTDRRTPVSVSGLASVVTKISAGGYHSCALLDTGGVQCWGSIAVGAIGDGTSEEDRLTAVSVSDLTSGVTQISAGGYHSCAILSTGEEKCWGLNLYGQIGDGTSGTNRLIPVSVSGLTSGVTQISTGTFHSCALLSTEGVKCWGNNGSGRIGDGTSGTSRLTPVSVLN